MNIKSKDGNIYKVRKYIISNDGEESVWCDDWYGRHVICNDCNWEDSEIESLKAENEGHKEIARARGEAINELQAENERLKEAVRHWQRELGEGYNQ
jgi:hypothetical protein